MWERLKEWLQRRMAAGVQDCGAPLDDFVARYEDGEGENITAIIAGKLAMPTQRTTHRSSTRCL